MKNQKRLFWILALLALLPRLLICLSLCHIPAVASPSKVTDMATYLRLAKEICAGQWPHHFDYQPFYYSLFLPFCRCFSGDSPQAIMIFQLLLGVGTVLLAAKCAEKIYGYHAAICTGILLAISKIHVFYAPFALLEILQSFWMVLILWLCLILISRREALEKPGSSVHNTNNIKKYLCRGGLALLLSFATLTRGNALLLLPGILVLLFWLEFKISKQNSPQKPFAKWLRGIICCLLFILLFELPQLPFALRNYHAIGRWTGASTAGEKVLVLGNSPEAPAGGLEYPLTYYQWTSQADRPPLANPPRIPVTRQILNWAKKEPLLFLNLQWEKLILFWDAREIPNNVSLDYEGRSVPWLKCLLPTGAILILAIIGLFCCRRPFSLPKGILLYFVLVLWGANSLFYILARFRLAALPILAIPAGGGLCWLWEHRRDYVLHASAPIQKRFSPLLALLVSLFLVLSLYRIWQEQITPLLVKICRPNGTIIVADDRTRLYDHGPLQFGGASFFTTPQEGLVLEKRLILPKLSRPIRACLVRLPIHPTPGQFLPLNHLLQVNGITYPVQLTRDRFLTWLEAEVPFAVLQNSLNQEIKIRWSLPKGTSVLLDCNRHYGRTLINGNPFSAEADTEVDFLY